MTYRGAAPSTRRASAPIWTRPASAMGRKKVMQTSARSTMLSTFPPALSTSPGCATWYCTRPSRGAVSVLSLMSARSRSIRAFAASTDASASITWDLAIEMAAVAAATFAFAALTAASAASNLARSVSRSSTDPAPFPMASAVRANRFFAASYSAWRCVTMASAAAFSLSRCATLLRAVSTAFVARWRSASASWSWATSASVSIRARTWPVVTKSPSFTRISLSRPAAQPHSRRAAGVLIHALLGQGQGRGPGERGPVRTRRPEAGRGRKTLSGGDDHDPTYRVHADRAIGGDRDHRRVDRPAPARRPEGPGGRRPRQVHEQPQAARARRPDLPRCQQPVPGRDLDAVRPAEPGPPDWRDGQPV